MKQAGKAPISTHPAFSAIVALWFACLLGLGSLVLPIALFERLVAATGMAALVPASEPPLGFAARVVIALTGAFGGAAAGLLLARQVARSYEPGVRSRGPARTDARECRPIAAHAELGDEGFEWLDFISEHGSPMSDEAGGSGTEIFAPPAESRSDVQLTVNREDALAAGDWWRAAPGLYERVPRRPLAADEPEGVSDLIGDADDWQTTVVPPVIFATPIQRFSEPSRAAPPTCPPVGDSPLEELGLVQLAGRLGAAIENRRALKASRTTAAPAPAPFAPADFEAAEPEDAARAIASFFGSMEASDGGEAGDRASELGLDPLPAMKNPFSRHEEFVHGDVRKVVRGAVEPIVNTPAAAPAGPFVGAQTSVHGSSVAPVARSEEYENTEDFTPPPSLPRDSAASKRDLRAALATLQRISGAA